MVIGYLVACFVVWLAPSIYDWVRRAILFRNLPSPSNAHWLYGVTRGMKNPSKIHRLNLQWSRTEAPLVAFRVIHMQAVVIYDPVLIHKICSREMQATKPHHYRVLTKMTSAVGCKNLVSMGTEDEDWKLARKGLAPAFAQKNIKQAFQVVRAMASKLCQELLRQGSDKYIDMDEMAMRETIDIISQWGFGTHVGCIEGKNALLPGTDLLDDMHACMSELSKHNMIPFRRYVYKYLPGGAEIDRRFKNIYAFTYHLLDKAEAAAAARTLDEQCIAAHLFRLRDSKGNPLNRHQLASQAGVFFFAGHDTTGHTIAYTLYLLSQNPAAESKLVDELDDHGLLQSASRPQPRQLEYDDLCNLKYLQAVVKEAMRLLPVVTAIGRTFPHDVKVEGYLIPRQTPMILSLYPALINCWEDGEAFKPERWFTAAADSYDVQMHNMAKVLGSSYTASVLPVGLNGEDIGKAKSVGKSQPCAHDQQAVNDANASADVGAAHPKATAGPKRFTPFSEGPRDCIGQSLARVSVPTTVAMLTSRFSFKLDPTFDHSTVDFAAITLRPDKGIPLRCIPRVK